MAEASSAVEAKTPREMEPDAEVVVIGGANIDRKSQLQQPPTFGTSNPGSTRTSSGGVGRNVAENLARLRVRTALISVIGRDADGERLRRDTEAAGVDLHHVVTTSAPTGTYTALLDAAGDMLIAVSAMDAMDALDAAAMEGRRHVIMRSRIVVLDCNVPKSGLSRAAAIAREGGAEIVVDPVSVAKATRLAALLDARVPIHTVTPNLDELRVLTSGAKDDISDLPARSAELHGAGVQNVWVRLGARGSFLSIMNGDTQRTIGLAPCSATLVDATGAGDAMLAGYVAALLRGLDVAEAARYGRAAAAITIESRNTVSETMSPETLSRRAAACVDTRAG
jgi:pseudouridine kinase